MFIGDAMPSQQYFVIVWNLLIWLRKLDIGSEELAQGGNYCSSTHPSLGYILC